MAADVFGAAEHSRGEDTVRVHPGMREVVTPSHALHFMGVPVCSDPRAFVVRRLETECATRAAMVLALQADVVGGGLQGVNAVLDSADWLATSPAIHCGTKPLAQDTSRLRALYPTRFVHGDKCTCGAVDSQSPHYTSCPDHPPGCDDELVGGGVCASVKTKNTSLLGVSVPAAERRPAQDPIGGLIAGGPTLDQAQLVRPDTLHRLMAFVVLKGDVDQYKALVHAELPEHTPETLEQEQHRRAADAADTAVQAAIEAELPRREPPSPRTVVAQQGVGAAAVPRSALEALKQFRNAEAVRTKCKPWNEPATMEIVDFCLDLRGPVRAVLAATANVTDARGPAAIAVTSNRGHDALSTLASLFPESNPTPLDRHAKEAALTALAAVLADPRFTRAVVAACRPLLLDLVARIVHASPQTESLSRSPAKSAPGKRRRSFSGDASEDANAMDVDTAPPTSLAALSAHESTCVALATIVLIAPQSRLFVARYFAAHPPPTDRLALHLLNGDSPNPNTLIPVAHANIEAVLLATHRLLAHVPAVRGTWNLHPLHALVDAPVLAPRARVVVAHILAEYFAVADAERAAIVRRASETDAFFALEELAVVRALQDELAAPAPAHAVEAAGEPVTVTADYLSPYVVDVCGILLPTDAAPAADRVSTLVETPTTRRNICAIAMAASLGSPVLLEGITGSGKTCLIEDLAARLGRASTLTKIHLGDQSDGKTLLGTYVATSTPGQFAWSRGVLTRAVMDGHWLVLEDIDMASKDVVSLLVPLLEKRTLYVPQRGQEITAHPNFQLFATTALDPFTLAPRMSAAQGLGASLWTHVRIAQLGRDELLHVLARRFPRLAPLTDLLVAAFEQVAHFYHDPTYRSSYQSGGRYMSTRDLIKWCHRAQILVAPGTDLAYDAVTRDENVVEPLLKEAIDVFVCMIPNADLRRRVLGVLCDALDVPAAKRDYFATQYAPELELGDTTFAVGRVALPLPPHAHGGAGRKSSRHPFATTGHAKRLLERIAVAVAMTEPVLLVGETGCGKTTVVQHLARTLHKRLHVINLSQQTESSDLMGGFKPASMAAHVAPLVKEFYALFAATFSVKKNQAFLDAVRKAHAKSKFEPLVVQFMKALKMAQDRFDKADVSGANAKAIPPQVRQDWKEFGARVADLRNMLGSAAKLFFSFVEGTLVSAIRKGDWVLLDEVNLASAETLESLSGLLEQHGSLLLTERGDEEVVPRHPEFRIFACMNPATDVGKRDLPIGLRNRFTEIYVESPDNYLDDLTLIVGSYLATLAHADANVVGDVVQFYLDAKRLAESSLYDGAGTRPHFSLRTLSRALSFVAAVAPMFGLRRALFEGFSMTFLTLLDLASQRTMLDVIHTTLLRGNAKLLKHPTPAPANPDDYVQFESFWLRRGPHEYAGEPPAYILTPSVHRNLLNLARSVMTAKYPVLIQGPTSSGKTSMIEHLARVTHHQFVRINNHEHTDLQEYLGCYVSDDTGKLVFKEGALVTALKEGHWIVLDELNLAPTDVLEALNRLLDDNRELFIPETQQVVRPHPHFMLFATQNPPSYGGRKVLSRAFRNRFLELHFDDLPDDELHTILAGRCAVAPSYAKAIIAVYQELRKRRMESRLFDGKASFATLRDLFRWANRPAQTYQALAENGWMILGERVRSAAERKLVIEVLQGMKKGIVIDPPALYARTFDQFRAALPDTVVWNNTMKRLFALTVACIQHHEPVLLVGETGCGKTTVCQVLAQLFATPLVIVNCHQHSETSDFIGSQRPARGSAGDHDAEGAANEKLFEWQDGPLIQAMKHGHYLLLDEISLADDSVLERLNSILEPARTLLIAEKGGDVEQVTAVDAFRFLATMNPGGDYGKKELSPALRNRFTEIWTDQVDDYADLHEIVAAKLRGDAATAATILDYVTWFKDQCRHDHVACVISMRDLIAWAEFVLASAPQLGRNNAVLHGGAMVLLDGLKSPAFAARCLAELEARTGAAVESMTDVVDADGRFGIGAFTIAHGTHPAKPARHTLNAPTSRENLLRVLRALQIPAKAILFEGSPGVGKTSLVSALAQLSGHALVRINLSEQTDLIDLFGSDLPVEGGAAGEFAWRDGPFLAAMKAGDWVLLDELNLASQPVLEGLNACLDHRGSVYLPELDRSFDKHADFRIFGAQNPLEEGGGRRGLPKSFLNRFTQVHVMPLTDHDLMTIVADMHPNVAGDAVVRQMLEFNSQLHHKTMVAREFGMAGSPWEFNLRDVLRWLELMAKTGTADPAAFLDVLYLQCMQSDADRAKTLALWNAVTGADLVPANPDLLVTPESVAVGSVTVPRATGVGAGAAFPAQHVLVPHSMLRPLHALLTSVHAGWMSMVIGPSGSGKTELVRAAAALTGNALVEFAMNSSVDALELLGGFEQVDRTRCIEQLTRALAADSRRVLAVVSGVAPALAQNVERESLAQLAAYAHAEHLTVDQLRHWTDLLAYVCAATGQPDHKPHHARLVAKYEQLASVAGKFEWVDGVLLDAVQNGKWILLDNANLCSPSVLDRLNPLFEASAHRHLLINERGQTDDGEFVTVEPHPNFRMFMTLDPKFGQISRAMRNRGVEISLVDGQWMRDEHVLAQLLEVKGIRDAGLRETMLARFARAGHHSAREFVMATDYVADMLQRGFDADHAVAFAAHNTQADLHAVVSGFAAVPSAPVSDGPIVPHPPLLLHHSLASLVEAKFSYLTSQLVPDAHLAPAADCFVERADVAQWRPLLAAWMDWRTQSPALAPLRVSGDHLAVLLDRMAAADFARDNHVLAKAVLLFIKLQLAQESVLDQTANLKLSKMNVVQRSHCFTAFPHRVSKVEIPPVVVPLYPLLGALEAGMAAAMLDSAASAETALPVLLWAWSMWSQCLVQHELNLDLLDAHVSQLIDATKAAPAFAQLHAHLVQLQRVYAGDMEASQAVWVRLHPWAVRTAELYQHVHDLLAVDVRRLPVDLRNLAVDALTNVFLGDATQQASLNEDLPRLVALIEPHLAAAAAPAPVPEQLPRDADDLMVVDQQAAEESVRSLVKAAFDAETQRSHAVSKWVWSSIMVQGLLRAHRSGAVASPATVRLLEAHTPSLAEAVHLRLLQWSLGENHAAESADRSWNMLYTDVQRVFLDQSLWRPQPKALSAELIAAAPEASVIAMETITARLKSTAMLMLDHQDLLQLDLAALERDLVAARMHLLRDVPATPHAAARIASATEIVATETANLEQLGLAWIHLRLAFMELAVPTSPLDPATRFSLVHHYTRQLQGNLELELQISAGSRPRRRRYPLNNNVADRAGKDAA
ncbi:AAA ATPase midasin [Blastocladiella emersonii ATCC 22665]|nr:AAA ATPase midasin [Blastocladiella emersonii ATCC 22665]